MKSTCWHAKKTNLRCHWERVLTSNYLSVDTQWKTDQTLYWATFKCQCSQLLVWSRVSLEKNVCSQWHPTAEPQNTSQSEVPVNNMNKWTSGIWCLFKFKLKFQPTCQKHTHKYTQCSVSSLSFCLPYLCSPCLSNGTYQGKPVQRALHRELLPPYWLWGKFLVLLHITKASCPPFSTQLFCSHGCMYTDSLSRNTPSFHMGMPRLQWLMCYQVYAGTTDKYGAVTKVIYCTS